MTMILRGLFWVAIMRRVADVNIGGINIDGLDSRKKYRCASVASIEQLNETIQSFRDIRTSHGISPRFGGILALDEH